MNRIIAPLRLFARHVEELPHKKGEDRFLRIKAGGHIGALVNSFNRMVEELDDQKTALLESEELYRTLVDFTSDFIFWRSADGTALLYVSPQCAQYTGYGDAEFYLRPGLLDEIVHPADRDRWQQHITVACSGNCAEPLELRFVTKTGATRWVNHLCRPVFDELGKLLGVRGSFSDISDRKKVEEAQLQQLHLLQTLIDAIPGPVFYKDPRGVYLGCNRAFEAYTGRAKEEIVGKTVFEAFPEELANVYYEADSALFRRPGVQCYETNVLFADGTLRDVMFYKATFSNIDGSLGGLVGTLLDITERKKSEDALRASEEKFRLFFEESRDAIFVTDQEYRLINVNQSVVDLFGHAREEIIGSNICETFCDSMCRHTLMEELLEKGYVREVEVGLRKKDGSLLVCLLSASLRKSESGEILGFQGIFHDITKRKQAEEELIRQNEYLAALNETTKGLISRLDLKSLLNAIISRAGSLMKTNHSYIYLLNRTRDRMERESSTGVFTDFFDYLIKKGYGLVGKVWQTGLPLAVDDYQGWSGRLPDPAREVLRAMVGIPLKSGAEVVGVIGLAHIEEGRPFGAAELDILTRFAELASLALDNAQLYGEAREELQERKRAEEQLRKLSHAVEQSPVSVVITDPAGNIEYVNPKFTETTGYASEEVIGKNPRILKSAESPAAEYAHLWQTITAGHEWRGEFHNKKKSGELYWELASISPIRNGEGAITHFIAVKEDITERKKLENQLRHSQKMDAVGKLAGGIAHDFNNIMTAIIGYASILDMKLDQAGPLGNSVKQILFSAKRAATLTEGLLAFSRKQVSNPRPVKLNDIVRRVEKILERLIGEDIELNTALSVADPVVMADPLQIEQVLMNLATNARDAMPEGGRLSIATDQITLDERFVMSHGMGRAGTYAKLTVADTGGGMAQETVKRVFDPFFTTKEVGKGTGLGLSIVYGIIEKHNGSISCYSEPGMGAIFTMFIPAIRAKVVEAAPEAALQLVGGTETILMAEDDGVVRKFARELLEEYGYKFIAAVDGEDAVLKFRENRDAVQLLILDLIMPRKNGREAYEEIRQLNPGVKVIFSSGYEADIIQRKGKLEAGLNYLAKPVTPEKFLSKIREVLDS
ncbi:MAG: PAS domain S-box protein [Geobacteraceae bacterium]|nr:PAS domain S-box protein [Geobacteraceae bacterium]